MAVCCFLSVKPHSQENVFLCVRAESSELPLLPSQTTRSYSRRCESCDTGSISYTNTKKKQLLEISLRNGDVKDRNDKLSIGLFSDKGEARCIVFELAKLNREHVLST